MTKEEDLMLQKDAYKHEMNTSAYLRWLIKQEHEKKESNNMSSDFIPNEQKVTFEREFLYENVGTDDAPEWELVGRKFFEETYIPDDGTIVK